MSKNISVRFNNDHALIAWHYEEVIPGCIGFALYRNRNGKAEVVQNRIGFEDGNPGTIKGKPMLSTEFPIQRFVWTDFEVRQGDKVKYKVVPMITKDDKRELLPKQGTKYTALITIDTGKKLAAYFNVGLISSQFYSKLAKDAKGKKLTPKSVVTDTANNKLRNFLGGSLAKKLFSLLDELGKAGQTKKIYLALFELEQEDLLQKLIKIGSRCHLILANGAAKNKTEDKNERARTALQKSGVNLLNRMVGSGHLAHNKFMVITDKKDKPLQVFTGSTNWTPNGIFGQVNNGILIDDKEIAAAYYAQWLQIKAAEDGYPATFIDFNKEKKIGALSSVWFNPTKGYGDLVEVRNLLENAKEGVLFLMFNPGTKETLYNKILEISKSHPKLYIRGILNQEPVTKGDKIVDLQKPIKLLDKGVELKTDYETILPSALKGKPNWEDESSIGLVRIHSKVIVIDPFGEKPCVITGSNNMGPKASKSNDDNLNIIFDKKLAEEYAVNIMSVYNHYHFRFASQLSTNKQYKGLTKKPDWMRYYLTEDRRRELNFWI